MRTVLVYLLQLLGLLGLLGLSLARNIHGDGHQHRGRISLTNADPHTSWNRHGSPNLDPHGQRSVTHVIHTSEPLDPKYRSTRPLTTKVLDRGQPGDITYSDGAMIIHSHEPIVSRVASQQMRSGHQVGTMHRGRGAMHAPGRLYGGQLSPTGVVIHHISPQRLLETMSNTGNKSPFASGHNHKMPQEKTINDHTQEPSVVNENSNINPFADATGPHPVEGGPQPQHRHGQDHVEDPVNHFNGPNPFRPGGTDPHFNEHLSHSNHGPGGSNIPGDAGSTLAGRPRSHGDALWLGNPGGRHGDVRFPGRPLPGDTGSSHDDALWLKNRINRHRQFPGRQMPSNTGSSRGVNLRLGNRGDRHGNAGFPERRLPGDTGSMRPGSQTMPSSPGHLGHRHGDVGFPGRPLSSNTESWRPGFQTMPLLNPVMPDRSSSLLVMNRQPNQWFWTGGNRSGKLSNVRSHLSRHQH